MTTDRPVASPRNTALAQRPAASSATATRGQQAPPNDAFSAMLAAQPKTDDAKPQPRGNDARQPKHDDRRADRPKVDRKPIKADDKAPVKADDADKTKATDDDTTPRPVVQPSIFALQLAGPLPVPPPAAPAAPATDAQAPAPVLPPQLAGPLPAPPVAPPVDPNAAPVDPNSKQET